MDEASPAKSISLPDGAAWQSRTLLARSLPVYDPAARPPAASRSDSGFGHLICRTPVIWLCALMLGVLVGGTLALTNPLAYKASGLLIGLGADETAAQDEIAIIHGDEVVRGIVDRLGLSRVAPGCVGEGTLAHACAANIVRAQMHARIVGDSNGIQNSLMMRLSAVHADPVIAVAMLDAAVTLDRQVWHAAHQPDRADALDPQLAKAQSVLDGIMADSARIRAQARVTNIAQDLSQAASETAALVRQDGDLRLRQAAVGAELQASLNALQTAPETVLDSREVSSGDPGQDSRAMLLQFKLQRAHMVQLYAPDYPGLAELDRKIQTIEAAMRVQAKSTSSVVRDVRNPVLTMLAERIAALESESAGLVEQRQELQRQLSVASTREASLRDVERRLLMLQQRQGTQEAVVRQLTDRVTEIRAQDVLTTAHLSQRRLLQRPEASAVPWTGMPAAVAIGTLIGLIYGLIVSTIAWRRRRGHGVVRTPQQALQRLDNVWMDTLTDAPPQLVAVPLPQNFGSQTPSAPQGPAPVSGSLGNALQAAGSMRIFASRRQGDIEG